MTDPANAASREARAHAILLKHAQEIGFKTIHPEQGAVIVAAMFEFADEAASQPREGVTRDLLERARLWVPRIHTGWHKEAADALNALHDTAPTDQAQGGGEVERLRDALAEIARRGALCIHQNTGRWNMTVEHDLRSYNILNSNNEIALAALAQSNPTDGGMAL